MEMKLLNSNSGHNMRTNGLMAPSTESLAGYSTDCSYDETGTPCREMAIDCPSNFVGSKKEPPKYPQNYSSLKGTGTKVNGSRKTVEAEKVVDPNQAERIRKYQNDIQKRKEIEEKIEKEKEFLRTSLRGSKKLRELEENEVKGAGTGPGSLSSGFVNPNYALDDDERLMKHTGSGRIRQEKQDGVQFEPLEIESILTAVDRTQRYLHHPDDQKEIALVSKLVTDEQFLKLFTLHNKIVEISLNGRTDDAVNLGGNTARNLQDKVLASLPTSSTSNPAACRELQSVLSNVHVQNLLLAYDGVSKIEEGRRGAGGAEVGGGGEVDEREYLYERASQYGEDSIKIVRLQKGSDPLGATVRNEGDSVIIGRIMRGGAAERCGLLHEGDEILEINGVDIRGKSVNEVCDIMDITDDKYETILQFYPPLSLAIAKVVSVVMVGASNMIIRFKFEAGLSGVLTFLINPSPDHKIIVHQNGTMHVRALFTYDPEEDPYIPCRELGVSFLKGDVLHVMNQDDSLWWQAHRDGEDDDQGLAGLIPSRGFQEQRERLRRMLVDDTKENDKKNNICHCTNRPKKKKMKLYNPESNDEEEPVLTYEEVALYYPQPNRKRPIVLVGPPSVGCQELRRRLMENNPDRFAAAIPHTTRTPAEGEVDRCDYHFVSRVNFEKDIEENRFVEYGEYETHYFGTTMDAIRHVVNLGKTCVLSFHPQALSKMKMSDLKPYFAFIAPPNIEKLRQMRQKQGVRTTEEELKKTIESAREMEETVGHYFDMIIVNQDLERAYDELLAEINRLELEPQWVPIEWVE